MGIFPGQGRPSLQKLLSSDGFTCPAYTKPLAESLGSVVKSESRKIHINTAQYTCVHAYVCTSYISISTNKYVIEFKSKERFSYSAHIHNYQDMEFQYCYHKLYLLELKEHR